MLCITRLNGYPYTIQCCKHLLKIPVENSSKTLDSKVGLKWSSTLYPESIQNGMLNSVFQDSVIK